MNGLISYLLGCGDALSQLANKVLLNGHPNESLSGRAWRTQSAWYRVIDALFFFDKDHCRISHENDLAYAKQLVEDCLILDLSAGNG